MPEQESRSAQANNGGNRLTWPSLDGQLNQLALTIAQTMTTGNGIPAKTNKQQERQHYDKILKKDKRRKVVTIDMKNQISFGHLYIEASVQ